jgi:hypothetical protein
MKKIYKTLLALAAVMTLGAVASAQDVPYLINDDHGLGYNKYLRTDEDGNRFIRIETFATGGGERKAIPADICLVLDNSGSMLYYYVTNTSAYKLVLTQTQVDAPTIPDAEGKKKDPLLVKDDLRDFTGEDDIDTGAQYFHGYDYTRLSTTGFGETNGISSSYNAFTDRKKPTTSNPNPAISITNCFRYAKHTDGKYYIVYHKTYKDDNDVTWYYLCYMPESGTEMYLRNTEFTSTRPTDSYFKSSTKTLFVGSENGTITVNGESTTTSTILWRSKTRKEKLEESVEQFINQIYANNQTIESELGDKVGNQIAIVAFGSTDISLSPYETGGPMRNCRIVKKFTPANSTANVTAIKGGLDRMSFLGNTSLGYGMVLANEAFRLLRNNNPAMDAYELEGDGVTYKMKNGHPVPNRSKVVVMFTDGSPTGESDYTASASAPYTAISVADGDLDWSERSSTAAVAVRSRAIDYARLMKKTETGYLNAKVFAVGLYATGAQGEFLQHLSSNFPKSRHYYEGSSYKYAPTNATSDLFFFDAAEKDLSDVFDTIASIAGGKSDVGGTSLVNIDIVSKSFQIPRGSAGDDLASKIKVYTAQCLGLELNKTYEEDGVIKHYLAFAEPKEIKSREPVKLWVSKPVEGSTTGEVTWEIQTIDVDEGISVTVEDDADEQNDVIKVTGFDYAKFWCGFDGDPAHSTGADANTEDYVASDYGSYDLHTGPYIKGYRGFKIIIDIPIALQDNAVGGPSVNTNEAGSGLLDPSTGTMFVEYPRPKLTIPVNLWIQKEGLQKGESASFVILRKLAEATTEEPTPTYKPLTNVLVSGDTKDDGTSKPVMVKLLNLDPAYYYKVVEEGWSWSYTSDAQDEETAPTTETKTTNPIIIENTPKPSTPKHDEAVKRNNM